MFVDPSDGLECAVYSLPIAAFLATLIMPYVAVEAPAVRSQEDKITIEVPLSGEAEREAGDLDGSGLVELTIDPAHRLICYDFQLSGVATPLMAHIHRGAERQSGPSVVTLFTGPDPVQDCLVWTEKRLAEIVADPSNFYVNLSTTEYPDGAVRGQLRG